MRVGQVGEDPRACSARGERSYSCGKLNVEVAGHADILVTIFARKSARMSLSVSVSVSVPWNASLSDSGACVRVTVIYRKLQDTMAYIEENKLYKSLQHATHIHY